MIEFIKAHYKGLLIFVGIILIACTIWIVAVNHNKTEYDAKLETLKLKNYVDSLDRIKQDLILDANTQINQLKQKDSLRAINKVTVIKTKNEIKNLNHSALQHALDTIRPK